MNTDGTGYSVLQSFPSTPTDGQVPNGDLTLSADASTLYGMTEYGGTADYGVVFSESVAPEPTSGALLGLGALLLAAHRRRA